ncbi:MAG: response regulator transcription factor, partial [Gammaproteobacteria bacterium]
MGTLCAALRTAGFDVRIAERPASLEATLLQHAADVVVMDSDAPEGFAAAAQLRTRHSVGLVMLRTGIDREDRLLALSAGADHLLAKPADPRELVAVVRNLHLRLRSAAPAAAAGSARAWRFDPVQWILGTPDGRSVQLSMAEQLVIGRLLDVPGRVAARAELVELLARHGIR